MPSDANPSALPDAIVYRSAPADGDSVVRRFPDGVAVAAPSQPGATGIRWQKAIGETRAASTGVRGGSIRREGFAVSWEAGAILLEGPFDVVRPLLSAILDIDRLHIELSELEEALPAMEARARSDVPFAFRIRGSDRGEWDRLGDTIESLATHRLTFARLQAAASVPSADLSPIARRVYRSMARQTSILERLEAASERLEALEDLYEGAVDRVNDHRYWRDGHVLEVIIIAILVLECLMIGVDLFLRFRESNAE